MSEYFLKLRSLGGNVKVELDLSNYATKADLKNATGVDTSKFAKKVDLASLKSEIYKLDVDKLETTPVDLKRLNDVVDKEVVKKDMYDEFIKKVNAIQTNDTSDLVKKTDYNTKIGEIEKNITDHDHNNKFIITQEFNTLAAENFAARLKQANLAIKAYIDDFIEKTNFDDKLKNLNKKVTSNKTRHLKAEKKLIDLTNKASPLEKGYNFC